MMHKNRSLRILSTSCCLIILSLIADSPTPTSADRLIDGKPLPPDNEPLSPDIVGGQDSQMGDWPWHVGLVESAYPNAYNGFFCSGSLIDSEWVVTAAHCTYDFFSGTPISPSSVEVVLGRTQLSSNEGQRLGVSQIIRHQLFDSASLNNDIALLKLAQAANLNENVQVIPVVSPPEIAMTAPGTLAVVSGWGATWGFFPVDDLRDVTIPIVSQQACQAAYNDEGITITDGQLCAGEDGSGMCYWDSGGPLSIPNASQDSYQLAGIVSTGTEVGGCAAPGKYDIFTRVAAYVDWLHSMTGLTLSGYQINLPLVIK